MIFNLDTNNCENINLTIGENECNDISLAIQEFAFGIASFFTDFMMKLNCDTEEKATKVKGVCMSCLERNLDTMIKEVLLENDDEDLELDIEGIVKEMKKNGFSDEEIANITKLISDCGSVEAANEFLREFGEENGINWEDEED